MCWNFKALTLNLSTLCGSSLKVSEERRGYRICGCCLLKSPLLRQIHIVLNMEILGCVHGKAWNLGLAVVGLFLFCNLDTHANSTYVHISSFISFIFFHRFDLALLPSLLWVPGCTLHIHNVGYASDSER